MPPKAIAPLKELRALALCTPAEVRCAVQAIREHYDAERDNLRFLETFSQDPDPDSVVSWSSMYMCIAC